MLRSSNEVYHAVDRGLHVFEHHVDMPWRESTWPVLALIALCFTITYSMFAVVLRKKVFKQTLKCYVTNLMTPFVVLSWFGLNISIGIVMKWLYLHGEICMTGAGEPVCKKYKFPLTVTALHMIFSWVMCRMYMAWRGNSSQNQNMGLTQQATKIFPLAACFALSVGMGNLSLEYIFPSFNQMLGASSPLITVIMMVLVTNTRYNAWAWGSMPIICGGIVLCAAKEVNFHLLGALFCFGATVMRGAKSIIQGKILSSPGERLDSVALLYYMAPWSAALLVAMALITEGQEPFLLLYSAAGANSTGLLKVLMLLGISGLNACLLNISNFLVTFHTNAVTLQVLGNVKTVLSIAISVCIFRNPLSLSQAVGCVVCLGGVWIYNSKGKSFKGDQRPKETLPTTEPQEASSSFFCCLFSKSRLQTECNGFLGASSP
jgi:drug/metabolite transporter (DMT)-like permease